MSKTESNAAPPRLDKWLWAARFFKTRRLATEAIQNGKVRVDGQRAKPSRLVKLGSMLSIQKGAYQFDIEVLELSDNRGPAVVAQTLYQETEESQQRRERIRQQMRMERDSRVVTDGRPDKHDRRRINAIKRQI